MTLLRSLLITKKKISKTHFILVGELEIVGDFTYKDINKAAENVTKDRSIAHMINRQLSSKYTFVT